jgi:hypothetical protein
MKISKKSWHYKLFAMFESYSPNQTICGYVRGILKSVALMTMFAVIAGILLLCWGVLIAEPIIMTWRWAVMDLPFTPYLGEGKETPWFVFVVSMTIHGIVVAGILYNYIERSSYLLGLNEPPQEGTFRAVVRERYRGWKGKYCPTVEFIDEEDE